MRVLNIECAETDKGCVRPTAGVVRIQGDIAFGASSDELAFAGSRRGWDFERSTGVGSETEVRVSLLPQNGWV